ncbi:MAG: hypothetical protein AB8G96_14915 [Phycisphaerales bacterium]
MIAKLLDIDRRWIFLLMLLAVAIPILTQATFPEVPTGLAKTTFDKIEALDAGDRVYMAFDFDPASEGELGPMATSFTRHVCELARQRKQAGEPPIRMYFATLWPAGTPLIQKTIDEVIKADFPELQEHEDWVNLGFKAGEDGVIKVVATDLRQMYLSDTNGVPLSEIEMMKGVGSIRDFDLIINVSAGFPGTKEWVLYAVTPFAEDVEIVAGCTGVQAPLLYPYIPQQLPGLLGAIKGAAEYEALVLEAYGNRNEDGTLDEPGKYTQGSRRMGPQLVAHVLMVMLIVAGNVLYFMARRRGIAS